MTFFLFLDESGHDHKNAPYEVRGGIALHVTRLWPFVQAIKILEGACFGDALHRYGTEIKGHKLLDKKRFQWAAQDELLDDLARRKHAVGFLYKGREHKPPTRVEFTAYGQACLAMARGIFELLRTHKATLFAVAIPCSVKKPATYEAEEYLRRDHVYLFERYFYFLEEQNASGVLVLDETDNTLDRDFVRRLERYFLVSHTGRLRRERIVPTPFFVSSDMAYPIQAADVCIYCVNHAFRLRSQGMDAPFGSKSRVNFGLG